jgi:hypothetical protein
MKKYVSIIAIMLCSLTMTVKAATGNDKQKKSTGTECSCCKNCKEEKCKELCTKWCAMTAEEKKSVDGKKVKEECIKICKEKKCCSSDGKATTCEGMMDGKDCCKKK